jgi:hypothetical protein
MKQKVTSFLLGLLVLSGLIWLLALLILKTGYPSFYTFLLPYMLIFFYIINMAFFIIFSRIYNTPNNIFIKNFLLLFSIKFFIYFIAIISVLLIFKSEAIKIATTAMILYIVFSIYELPWLLSMTKRKK